MDRAVTMTALSTTGSTRLSYGPSSLFLLPQVPSWFPLRQKTVTTFNGSIRLPMRLLELVSGEGAVCVNT